MSKDDLKGYLVSAPLPWDDNGGLLVDGGVLNNLPTDVGRAAQEGPVIGCDLLSASDGEQKETLPANLDCATLPRVIEELAPKQALCLLREVVSGE